jgi:microcin C transport system permease protein
MFSNLMKQRFGRFKKVRRAWVSLWVLGIAFVLSLGSEFLANDKPLVMRFHGKWYFPIVAFYPAAEFGGTYRTEADYLALSRDSGFSQRAFMLFPPIPHNPLHAYLDLAGAPPHKPSREHWLGTDSMARDVLARLIYGFRTCMLFSLLLVFIEAVIGIIIGGVQGYFGGVTDIVLQRIIEIWSSLPFLYVVILVGSIYGTSFVLLVTVMAVFHWIGLSYFMRGEFYRLKSMTYVKAARAMGAGPVAILFGQILPNALTPVITIVPFSIIGGISSLTALDFLGFGLPPPTPSWGELLQQGLNNLYAPWIAVATVVSLFVTLMLTNFLGEGVREAFDPKSEDRLE